jgi:hypothetical protein
MLERSEAGTNLALREVVNYDNLACLKARRRRNISLGCYGGGSSARRASTDRCTLAPPCVGLTHGVLSR